MGGETSAIQRVAGKISDDIFSVFKWDRAARADMNWDCCQEAHSKKTHPSDVVFFYIDPYEEEMVYLFFWGSGRTTCGTAVPSPALSSRSGWMFTNSGNDAIGTYRSDGSLSDIWPPISNL